MIKMGQAVRLMPVDDQFWLDPVDFVGQRVEALVDAVFAVIECRAGSCGYHAIVVIPQYS